MSKPKYGRTILIDRIPDKLYDEFKALTLRRGTSLVGLLRKMMESAVYEDEWMNQGGRYDIGDEPVITKG